MKCKFCVEKGMKSKLYTGGQSVTLMTVHRYYDEDGDYHCHDPNTITRSFSCSNGHDYREETKIECASCKKDTPND